MADRKRVIIIGGGLAGLAAAIVLPPDDFQVTLLERRPFLGGRASSYPVPKLDSAEDRRPRAETEASTVHGGEFSSMPKEELDEAVTLVDNCQHILMKCCTNLLDFYRRLSVHRSVVFFDSYVFLDDTGRMARLRPSCLPAPFHLLPSFLRFHPLHWKDKLGVAYALACMLLEEARLESLDRITILEWLQQHRQTARAIEMFWQPVLVSALNEEISRASARYGLKVFLDGLLKHRDAFQMGVPVVPLERLYTRPCLGLIQRNGGQVRLRCSADRIELEDNRISGVVLNDGNRLTGDYYMSSIPPQGLLNLLPSRVIECFDYFQRLREFENSPITSIYLWFDRQVTALENTALLGREIHWIFNKGSQAGPEGTASGQHLSLVVSASRRLAQMGRAEILEIALRDLQTVLPASREARLLRTVVLKEPYATISCKPGCDSLRVDQQSPFRNVFVAGDWTRTGWPPTMEGAVRSSYRCAELILQSEGRPGTFLRPDLPVQRIPGWIAALSKRIHSIPS